MKVKHLMEGLAALLMASAMGTVAQAAGKYDGVTVNIMTFTGPVPASRTKVLSRATVWVAPLGFVRAMPLVKSRR